MIQKTLASRIQKFFEPSLPLVACEINRRAIALPLRDLRNVRTVVFAAGGKHKVRAIAAVLRGGYGSVLVCDEATAGAAAKLARDAA